MRNEQEMLAIILDTAASDERIRAVILNGSRANPNALRDPFQDYDIVYLVKEVTPFVRNYEWIARFGELMVMQMPEGMSSLPRINDGRFVYLMQFTDGNRIDLTLYPIDKFDKMKRDSLSVLLLDKDGVIGPLPPPTDRDYLPEPPTAKAFNDCCNEFWWVCPYVAKGLWRQEIVYARHMLDGVLRDQLEQMLRWHIGVTTHFLRNPGSFGRHMEQYLDRQLWDMLLSTYVDASYDKTWDALFMMSDLFRMVALSIANHFGFEYPWGDDERVSTHLRHVRHLPRTAKEIYS